MKGRLTQVLGVLVLAGLIQAVGLVAAGYCHAAKYQVLAHEQWYHYGVRGQAYVNHLTPKIGLDGLKVVAFVTHRTDWTALTEIGHSWVDDSGPFMSFLAFADGFSYTGPVRISGRPTEGTWRTYGLEYYAPDQRHRFWLGSSLVKTEFLAGRMTSSWPCVMAEKEGSMHIDNSAHWRNLQYKNSSGNWLAFGRIVDCYTTDPLYENKWQHAPTEHKVLRIR